MIGATRTCDTLIKSQGAFSPLFIGVIGATEREVIVEQDRVTFSPLFIGVIGATFICGVENRLRKHAFSPLFIGVIGATQLQTTDEVKLIQLSVPYSSG